MGFANEQYASATRGQRGRAGEADYAAANDGDQWSIGQRERMKPARGGARSGDSTVMETHNMFRTIFAIGIMALLGLFALKFIFGVFGGLIALLFILLRLAIKVAIIGLLVYLVIRIVSPETARNLRERWGSRD